MANFNEAFIKTAAIEGGYVNDPADAGGETYKGVSRRFNPSWTGWKTVDELKQTARNDSDFKRSLDQNEKLQEEIRLFYKQNFWDRFWGDKIPEQEIAEEVFDTGVNLGVRSAVTFLQESLNLLNRNQKNYADIVEDGLFGPDTLNALETCLKIDDFSYLLKLMNILQGTHYIEYMRTNPTQERFVRGWLKRVNFSR